MMFEGYKINKLVSGIISKPGKVSVAKVKSLREFGPDGLAGLVEAFKSGKILGPEMEIYMDAFYEKSFLELYIELLGDSKEEVRKICKNLIAQKSASSAIPFLIEFLEQGNYLQRKGSVELLKKLGNTATADKVAKLLDHESRDVKGAAMEVLAAVGGEAGSSRMIALLSSNDWWVRKKVINALCKLKDPKTLEPLLNRLDVEKDPKIKAIIITTISAVGDSSSAKRIIPHLREDDLVVRQMVVEALEKLGNVEIIEDVINIMKDADVNIRRAGVEILQNIKDPKAVATLIQRLRDPDWWVREIATDALADLNVSGVNEKVMALFKNKDENIRRAAVEYFKRVPDSSAFDSLVQLLKDEDWWVREKAVEALGKLKNEKAIDELILLVDDPDVRWAVPMALGEIGGQKSISYLSDFMSDPDRTVRLASVKGLGKIMDKGTLPLIKSAVKDSDVDIRDTALEIIKKMTGRSVKASEIIAEQERADWQGGSTVMSAYTPDKPQILVEAILVLDLCNSTEMGARYGDDFALKVTTRLVEETKPVAKRNRVRFTKSTGDGYLMTFGELSNALNFAKDISSAVDSGNENVPEIERIDIRIALNFGETRVDTKGDRLGTAVNKTFRVEGVKGKDMIEDEGGMKPDDLPLVNRILITEEVCDRMNGIDSYATKYVGYFDLKGITGRQKIYQAIPNG